MSAAQVLTGSGVLSAAGCAVGAPGFTSPRECAVGISQPAQPMAQMKLEFSIPSGADVLQQPQSLPGRGRGVCVDNQV